MATKKSKAGERWPGHMSLIVTGEPSVDGTIAAAARHAGVAGRDEYCVELATRSDDAGPERSVAAELWVTGDRLAQIFTAARGAGWVDR